MKIFIVLTHTGTLLSKIIKYYTRKEFSHVSISLDENLNEMYSFGRLNPYNPFIGGFVHEHPHRGTFARFKNTKTAIYTLDFNEEEYNSIKSNIKKIEEQKEKYKFNIIGLIAVSINMKIKRNNAFYCAEFVKYTLEKTHIAKSLPKVIKPEDFKKIEDIQMIYRGLLREYKMN